MAKHFYSFKFGLGTSVNQSELLQALRSAGDEAIQTSDGLCVASARDPANMKTWLNEKDAAEIRAEPLDAPAALAGTDTPPDVRAFLGERLAENA